MEKLRDERYEACFRLFLLHNGRNFCLIEREMRALGYADFNRRILYSRTEMGEYKPGWIERYFWKDFLRSPPYEGGVAAASADGVVLSDAGDRQHQLNRKSVSENHPPAEAAGPLLRKEGSFASAHALKINTGGSAADHISNRPGKAQPFRTSGGQSPKEDFKDWLKSVSPEMTWDWRYQKYIYRHLQKITSGESKRLMIFLPPRHGKSEMVTVRYAGWRLWNDPKMRVIVTSYNQRLADKFSRSIRRLLSTEEDRLTAPPDNFSTAETRRKI